jgi:uncharacterized protein with GYD domain
MPLYVMATRLAAGAPRTPASLEDLERQVMSRVEEEGLEIRWLGNYALLGRYDYLDVFEAPSNEVAFTLAALVQTFGQAHTEVWPATRWEDFKTLLRGVHADPDREACGWVR